MRRNACCVPPVLSIPNRVHLAQGPCSMEARHKRTRWLLATKGYLHELKTGSSRIQNRLYHAICLRSQAYCWLSQQAAKTAHIPPSVVGVSREKQNVPALCSHRPVHRHIDRFALKETPCAKQN